MPIIFVAIFRIFIFLHDRHGAGYFKKQQKGFSCSANDL